MPAAELEAVFDRFHRIDIARSRTDGGSGLGLIIARAIITDHDGTLTAASNGPGTGSTFTIQLASGSALTPGSSASTTQPRR